MKKIIFSIAVAAMIFASCSDKDADEMPAPEVVFVNSPLAGKIYSQNFTVGGGYARPMKFNGQASLYIYFGTASMECFGEDSDTPLWVIVPAVAGKYSSNQVSAQFRKSNGDYEGAAEKQIEITEITGTKVKGKLLATGFNNSEHNVNGTFEVQYCPL